jgi:hypothetical protein
VCEATPPMRDHCPSDECDPDGAQERIPWRLVKRLPAAHASMVIF